MELEFADSIHGGCELSVAAAGDIHATDRDPFDQNLMAETLTTVDGSVPSAAHGSRHSSKDEVLQLSSAIADDDRPVVDLLLIGVDSDLSR